MNRLQAYVKRTILESAKEGAAYYRDSMGYTAKAAKKKAMQDAFTDAMRGTETGWWNGLIYNRDVIALANAHRASIADAVREYLDETGISADEGVALGRDRGPAFATILWACAKGPGKWVDDDQPGYDHYEALSAGVRFAVEWEAGQLASRLGVEV